MANESPDFRQALSDEAAAESQFRLLVESVSDYVVSMLDPAGHVTTWNAGAASRK